MAEITAAMVMKLRDETGLPMMDCKKALQESSGDAVLAKQKLREKGIKPVRGGPTGDLFCRVVVETPVHLSREQKELLDTMHEKTGQDIFVASFSAMQHGETGEITSYSVWSKGADGLLPRTDLVHFYVAKGKEGEIEATADWDTVMRIAGDLMKPQGIYPERYRVKEFPSDEQLRRLGGD
jgi:hypothetical protein